ncbi:MAG: sensor histidine kinase [Actinomycetota bacterium]
MSALRPLALTAVVALAGAGGSLLVGKMAGMPGGDIARLALLMLPAVVVTIISAAAARPLLARASFRQRLVAIGLVAVVLALANLAVLAELMFVSRHDAALVGFLLLYSLGAGIGASVALARGQATAVERLAGTAERLAEGDLDARVGSVGAGPELDGLAAAMDRMADRVQRSIARERRAEAQRRDLITAVSHDLRTPLASLRAMVEAIDDRVVDDRPTLRRYAAEMRRSIDGLVVLVDDLFELAQLDAGAIEIESQRARLAEVVRSALEACQAQAQEKGLAVEQHLDSAGDAPCSPRLIRVLQNLLQNAIRHTPADGTVRVEAHRRPTALEVVVQDSGEGIGPGELDLIFEPFWRGDPARSGDGSGLGLALSKRIVEALGGEIRVQSRPSEGSRFAVILPDRGSAGPEHYARVQRDVTGP